ncbi:MAG: peroxiredoxin 2/4 [Patescibacteria group bacterium]|jgi:alkyl hydroperoxide reductase subunit AhpC|nr:peroxiredoxin 2/4 [Patescibacteria group bacterium]
MIAIGKAAPNFENVTAYHKGDFTKVSLSDYKGKWLVFFFYPRDFTFICPTELKGFAKHKEDLAKLGAEVLSASTDSEHSHKAWFERDLPQVDYPILADTTQRVSKDYGILDENDGSSQRGLFIIDPDGIVRYVVVSAGSVGRSVKEVLRVLEALQSGELCPVEWEPGQETLGKA